MRLTSGNDDGGESAVRVGLGLAVLTEVAEYVCSPALHTEAVEGEDM